MHSNTFTWRSPPPLSNKYICFSRWQVNSGRKFATREGVNAMRRYVFDESIEYSKSSNAFLRRFAQKAIGEIKLRGPPSWEAMKVSSSRWFLLLFARPFVPLAQKAKQDLLKKHQCNLVTHADYTGLGSRDLQEHEKMVDYTLLPEEEKKRPFSHIRDKELVERLFKRQLKVPFPP